MEAEKKKKRKKEKILNKKNIKQKTKNKKQKTLTPKGPDCSFWLYNDFWEIPVTRDFHISS